VQVGAPINSGIQQSVAIVFTFTTSADHAYRDALILLCRQAQVEPDPRQRLAE
jgi:hypothetical protein